MKNRIKIKTILIALMIMLVTLTSTTTQAWTTYTFDFSQDPYELNVIVGDLVVISIDRDPDSGDDMEKVLKTSGWGTDTLLALHRNDEDIVLIYPDQTLPTIINPITFTIGPFDLDDVIEYYIILILDNAKDFKDSSSFEVLAQNEPLVPDPNITYEWVTYILLGVGVLVVLIGVVYFYKKRRGK